MQRTVELPGWTVVSEQGSIDLGGHSTSDACLQACLKSATGCQFVQYTFLNGDCDGFAFANNTAVAMPNPDLKNNPSTFSLLTVTKKQDAYIEYNVNYPFEDFLHSPNNTPQSCLTYCQFHPECVRSSYKSSTKECWFKKVLRYNRTVNRDHVTFTFFWTFNGMVSTGHGWRHKKNNS